MSLADDAVVLHIAGFLPAGLFRLQRLCASVRRRLLSADVWLLAFRSGMKFASCDMGKTGWDHRLVAGWIPLSEMNVEHETLEFKLNKLHKRGYNIIHRKSY